MKNPLYFGVKLETCSEMWILLYKSKSDLQSSKEHPRIKTTPKKENKSKNKKVKSNYQGKSQYPILIPGNHAKNLIVYKRTGVTLKIKYCPQGPEWITKSSFFLTLLNKIVFQVNFVTNYY